MRAESLPWWLLDHWPHQGVQALIRDLNRVYRQTPALYARDCEPEGFRWIVVNDDSQSVLAFLRRGAPTDPPVAVICNFTPEPRLNYRLGLPYEGHWREAVNSDAAAYGGTNMGNFGGVDAQARSSHGFPASATLTLPPLATVYLVFSPPGAVGAATPDKESIMARTKTAKELGVSAPYSRHAMAYVLAGGRGSRLMELTDRRAKPAVYFGGKSRIIDFALSNALEFRHPPHRGRNPVQGPQPHPSSAARLELPPSGAKRELRHPARFTARIRDDVVPRHGRRRLSEHRHHRELRSAFSSCCSRATMSTRWTTRRCCSSTSTQARTSPSAASRRRSKKPGASA